MAETPIRKHASENDAEKMLRLCADDPMWAAHAEVSKSLLVRAADELAALRKDAERYRWLAARMLAADFDYGGEGVHVLVFEMPVGFSASADCGATIDAAMADTRSV